MYNIKRIGKYQIIIHSVWTSTPNGYDEMYHRYEDYLVEEPNWFSDDDIEEWKEEIRAFIEEEAKKVSDRSWTTWEKIRIWYDFGATEVEI